jgi:hypothetical protein
MKRAVMCLWIVFSVSVAWSQQYTGMSGLIHVPSAEMDSAGDARLGAHFLNKNFTPRASGWRYEGKPYHTFDFYLSLTPFKWVEIGYTITLLKHKADPDDPNGDKSGYTQKDRYLSIKFQPIAERKYVPAIAVGANDFITSSPFKKREGENNDYWRNYYVALTKHFVMSGHILGATVSYRHFMQPYNHRWNGVVGGVTYRPAFARNVRAILEWTGCDINFGVDCLLWKRLLIQASLQDGRYPSGGLCYKVNLF